MSLRFVLVRPRNPLNIGAAARAMANFGFSDLAVVKPFAPVWREVKSAVGAESVIERARAFASIDDAVADCSLVVGTTALRERRRDRPVVSLPELGKYLAGHFPAALQGAPAALLFGPEKTGLSGPYLERCQFWLTIPTSPDCPSMNLGQSVALCAYEWARAFGGARVLDAPQKPLETTVAQRRRLAIQVRQTMEAVHYLPFLSPSDKLKKIREKLLHWRIRRQDAALLHGFLRFVLRRAGEP
jgi:tRNA/rRNA methyltransferase